MFKMIKFVFAFLLLSSQTVFADTIAVPSAEARDWANTKGNELIDVLSETDAGVKFAKLDKMMTEDVNLDYIGRFVIGKYAKQMTPEQKQKYLDLFRRYVLSLYKKTNFNFDAHAINFTIDNVNEFPKFTNVTCSVDPGNLNKDIKIERIPIKFKLLRGDNNRIQAVDLEISNVSMVIEYRKRFYQMILNEHENIDWFLDTFENKVKANEEAIILPNAL